MREHKNEYVEMVQQYTAVTLSNNDTKIRGIITLFTITINIEFLLKPDEGRLYFSWHEGKKIVIYYKHKYLISLASVPK